MPRESSGKLGAPKGHPKYERRIPEITDVMEHTVNTCHYCNSELDTKEILEAIEEEIPDLKKLKVILHRIEWGICPKCNKKVIAKNNAPSDRFGPNKKARIIPTIFDRLASCDTIDYWSDA